jgi:hypothetical protein
MWKLKVGFLAGTGAQIGEPHLQGFERGGWIHWGQTQLRFNTGKGWVEDVTEHLSP